MSFGRKSTWIIPVSFYLLKVISFECLDCFIFRQSQLVVHHRCGMVSVFGPLPEFPTVNNLKQSSVFLLLMLKYGFSFSHQLFRANGNCHIYLIYIPFLPCPPVKPYIAIFHPLFVL